MYFVACFFNNNSHQILKYGFFRYYNLIGKPHLAHTVTSTQTRTSNYSSTNYSTADTHLADRGSTTNGNGRQVPEEVALRQVT